MFLPPIYSVGILVALACLYGVMRWLHGGPLLASRADVDSWWGRQLARIWAFRTWIVNSVGGVALALPDIIVALTGVDLVPLIGTTWSQRISTALIIFNAINAALKTKPAGEVAP